MKVSQVCGIALLLMVGSMMAFADGVKDPKIIIKGVAADLTQCPQCKGVGLNFSFTVPEGGSGELYFTNTSGKNWTSLHDRDAEERLGGDLAEQHRRQGAVEGSRN